MKKKKLLPMIGGAAAVALALGCLGGYSIWRYQQPKFHDLTIELGQPLPPVEDFLTPYAKAKKATLTTPTEEIDLSAAGKYSLSFTHGKKAETVYITVSDTTAPVLKLRDITVDIDTKPTPEDFVEEVIDLAPVELSLAQPLDDPETYGDVTVEIIATDASGNTSRGSCTLTYAWLHSQVTLEFGSTLTKSDIFINPERDGDLIDQATLDAFDQAAVGTYPITVTTKDNHTAVCQVKVVDTTPPAVKVRDATVFVGEQVSLEDFLVDATDLAGPVTTKLAQSVSTAQAGTYTVTLESTDPNGNVTATSCTLVVLADTEVPIFYGLKDIATDKHVVPNYLAGVSAYDNRDGRVDFTYDDSKVDLAKAGTYYVTYTAVDKAGNKATSRRKVEVIHDQSDTQALVESIAAKLSDDVVAICKYVRNNIAYSSGSDWGGDDPVWYGFTSKRGNCYVHALCYQELLTEKGYNTQLIWVTDKSHYWILVETEDGWKHIDPTPGPLHNRYNLMSDKQRLETLSGRKWDTSLWPECN